MTCSFSPQDPNSSVPPPSEVPGTSAESDSTNVESDSGTDVPQRVWYHHQPIGILATCLVLGLSLAYGLWQTSTFGNPRLTPTASPTATMTSTPTTTPTVTPSATPTVTSTTTATPRPRAYSPPTRIRIPKIDVDADVVEVGLTIKEENGELVTVWEVAKFAAGFHRGSAYPGHLGNTVISGHVRSRTSGDVFLHLSDLLPGDDVYLYADEQEFHYVVTQQMLLKEKGVPEEIRRENAKWIQPTDDERLTLVSCWPPVKPDLRVVVIAHRSYQSTSPR